MNQDTNTRVSPFAAIIFRLLNYIEIIALVATAVGFAMMYSGLEGAPEVLMIALSLLSGVFFLKGYVPPPTPARKDNEPKLGFVELLGGTILPKLGWIACSVTTVGILFRTLNLKGADEMVMIGCTVLTIALLLIGVFIVSKPDRAAGLMPLAYRAAPLWVVGAYLLMSK